MVKTVFGKKGKSLIFPVLSQGYVAISFNDYFSGSNDDPDYYGIYALENESFTLEAFITPYDTVGNGNSLLFSNNVNASSTEAQKHSLSNNESEMVFPSMSRLLIEDSGRTAKHYLAEVERRTSSQLGSAVINQQNMMMYGRTMTIFHNEYLNVALVNNGVSAAGGIYDYDTLDLFNPASYRLRATLYAGGVYDTVYSDLVINPSSEMMNSWSSPNVASPWTTHPADKDRIYESDSKKVHLEPLYYAESRYSADKRQLKIKRKTANMPNIFEIQDATSFTPSANSDAKANLICGMVLYNRDGTKIGRVADVGDLLSPPTFSNSREFWVYDGDTKDYTDDWSSDWIFPYIIPQKEALYMFNTHSVSFAFNYDTGKMALYYNGEEVGSKQHRAHPDSGTSYAVNENDWTFSLSKSDCYIGQNPVLESWGVPIEEGAPPVSNEWFILDTPVSGVPSNLHTQFYGEFHELAISKGFKKTFGKTQSFEGAYDNLLLYYQFDGGST